MQNLKKIIEQIQNKPIYDSVTSQFASLIEENEANRIKEIILPNITNIEREIDIIFFEKIKNCKNVESANTYFDILQEVQEVLSLLLFQENIEFSNKIQNFIRDCDRLDDEWLRNALFQEIKQGNYNYNFMDKL